MILRCQRSFAQYVLDKTRYRHSKNGVPCDHALSPDSFISKLVNLWVRSLKYAVAVED
ncbi:hypothetical protein [Nostoc sp.]|uniref:hypothetical protein n=1 Tax=Nostoc sp. TaxID=1180 RepID=UPI002FF74ABD